MKTIVTIIVCILAWNSPLNSRANTAKISGVEQIHDEVATSKTVHVEEAGTLSKLISEDVLSQLVELKITGSVNITDIQYLREATVLTSLDCSEASYISGAWSFNWTFPNIENIILPYGISSIGHLAFQGCSRLVNITIPNSVKGIDEGAFSGCRSLKSIRIPEGIKTIGKNTFYQCSSLSSISLPNSVTKIGDYAFEGCALDSIMLPNATSVGSFAFKNCQNLVSIICPCGITSLGERALFGCSKLKYISSLKGLTSIGWGSFWGCNLDSISIPESIKKIELDAFRDCANLKKVRFANIEAMCGIEYGNEYSKPTYYAHQIYFGNDQEEIKEITFPSSVTSIENYLFQDCKSIENIILPPNVTSIAEKAFLGCSRLEVFEFTSNSLPQEIGYNFVPDKTIIIVPSEAYSLYREHPSLHVLALNGYVIAERTDLFQTVNATAMHSNSTLLNALGEKGMARVYNLTVKGSINGYDIMMIRNKMPILRHLDLSEARIVANPYEYYPGCHSEDDRVGASAFRGLSYLVNVKLPKTTKYIDKYAFSGCSNLREVIFNEELIGIDDYAFEDCTSLLEIVIPEGTRGIGACAFYKCKSLQRVTIGEGMLTIGSSAFAYNQSLVYLSLPSTLEILGKSVFSECTSLKTVKLPNNIREIPGSAFYGCSALTDISIPPKVTEIGSGAFCRCSSLHSIQIPPMVETIGESAFYASNLNGISVYMANPKDIAISQNTFSTWKTATLYVPSFGREKYFIHPQWGQFAHIETFDEQYEHFYTRNTIILDSTTGVIDGTPDALLYEHGNLAVNDQETQNLDEVTLIHDGADCATLIPEDTGNIIAEKISIEINVRANNWHFFCFPFDIDLSSISYEGDYVWRQYDGAARSRREGGWQDLPDGTTRLKAGRGYIFQGTKAGVLHLEANHPTITGDDVYTGLKNYATEETTPADASWNFIGNPYTSYYAVDEDTYNAPITVWTGKGYEAYRPGDDDYEFAPYEAFFVQTPASSNTINFNADNREGYEQAQETQSNRRMARAQKKVNPNRLLVNLELGVQGEEEYLDKTRVVFNDECSLDYESDCDAAKFFSEERRAELYTIGADGTQYAINERPEDGGYVELGFVANQKGKYSISAPRMDVPMLLVDDVMETTFDLRNGAYEFSSAKGTFNKRFCLKRYEGITTSIKDLADQIGMNFCISDGTISIEGLNDTTRVCLYNMAGQQIATQQGNGTFTAIPGTYVISVGKLSAKIIVK